MSSEAFRCVNCGAPLDVSPDTIAVVCNYCGYLNWVRADLKEEVLVVKPLDERELLKRLQEFASRKRLADVLKEENIVSKTFVAVPYYFVDVAAEADYSGKVSVQVRKCRREKDRETCWTESRSVFVKGVYGPYENRIPVIARRGTEAVSVKALVSKYMGGKAEALPIESVGLSKSFWRGVLSIEVDKKVAMDIALNIHLNKLREVVTSEIKREAERTARRWGETVVGSTIIWKRITPKNIRATTSKPVLLPMYIASYRYGNELYRAILCGWDGDVIVLEKPVKACERALWTALAALSAGILGGVGIATVKAYIGFLLIILGFAASWYCMRKALAPVKAKIFGTSALGSVERGFEKTLSLTRWWT
ncbi:MAG: hypothetical protein LM572_04525 [Ignisphaera sp.]|jgi:hypothetical protein|nr:hypothetical protein [Ignisphaera sp.]MCC6056552.1 hypothetical protein [Desulfurococcaceae archaeon]